MCWLFLYNLISKLQHSPVLEGIIQLETGWAQDARLQWSYKIVFSSWHQPLTKFSTLVLCIFPGTLYCAKGNYEFGISRVIKSLEPYNKKLGTDTWFYAKRCFLSLIENLAKHMISVRDSVIQVRWVLGIIWPSGKPWFRTLLKLGIQKKMKGNMYSVESVKDIWPSI